MQISLAELKNTFCFSFKQISICLVIKDNKWIVDESFIGESTELMPKDSPLSTPLTNLDSGIWILNIFIKNIKKY